MPRFVLLHHQLPPTSDRPSHWDLMLELAGSSQLATWALSELPQPRRSIAAVRLADHRFDYLDYEGPVSGDRGTVQRVDAGTYTTAEIDPARWVLLASGTLLTGRLILEQSSANAQIWCFYWHDNPTWSG